MKHYLQNGAFHNAPDDIIPADAVEVPRLPDDGEAWDEIAQDFTFDGGPLLAEIHAQIDRQAEEVRAQYITPGAGQAMTYLQKQAEAAAVIADANAPAPILSAEAEAMGTTLGDLAAEVHANALAWASIGGKIEGARRAAKRAAADATTPATLRAAAQINWNEVLGNGS